MSQAINIPQSVGGNTAYVGFTGGTGGLSASQKILTWTYNAQPSPAPNPSFAMSSSPLTAIKAGSSSTSRVTITPSGGSLGQYALACAVTDPIQRKERAYLHDRSIRLDRGYPACQPRRSRSRRLGHLLQGSIPIRNIFAIGGETLAAAVLLFFFPIRQRKWQSLVWDLGSVVSAHRRHGMRRCK